MAACSISRRMSAGACSGPESLTHAPAGGCFDVGRIGEFQFQAMIAAGNTGRSLFQHSSGVLETSRPTGLAESIRPGRSALSADSASGAPAAHAQARFERAVYLAGKSLDRLLRQLIAVPPRRVDTGILNDTAVRLCVDLEHLREAGGAGSRASVLSDLACVHLRHLPLDDLVTLRSHVKTAEYASLCGLKATARTVLATVATALDEHVAWLATREPVGALADVCQTLEKGGTVGYDDVPEQIRLLHAGMNMLRDKSRARSGVPLGTQWRPDSGTQAEDRARFMTPSVRRLHDVSLACIEHMLTRTSAPAPVRHSLSQSARSVHERLDLNRVLAALGGAVRAEKVIRLQRCMNSATGRFDVLLEKVHGIFKHAGLPDIQPGPSHNATIVAAAKHPIGRFTDQNADERAFSMLRHALTRIVPGFLRTEASRHTPLSSAFGLTRIQSPPRRKTIQDHLAQHPAGMPAAYTRQHADAALAAGLRDASQTIHGIIERLDISPDLIELHPDALHDDLMLNALSETRLWHSIHADADHRPRAFSAV